MWLSGAFGMHLVKMGRNNHTTASLNIRDFINKLSTIAKDPLTFLAIVSYVIAMTIVMYIVAKLEVSFKFPITLGEIISDVCILGIACITVAIFSSTRMFDNC